MQQLVNLRRVCALSGNSRNWLLPATIVVLAVALVYGQFLWNPIVFDDLQFFMVDDPSILHFADRFAPFELRWLPYATLGWTAKLFGFDLIGFRIGNLLLHAATAVALYFFLSVLFRQVLVEQDAVKHGVPLSLNWLACFAALLFALHPVAVFGVGYLIQRTIVMTTLFSLLALLAYMRGLTQERHSWLAASVVFYYLAVFSKELALLLPAVMLALTLLLRKPGVELARKVGWVFVACGLIALWVVLQAQGVLGNVYEINAPQMLGNAHTSEVSGVVAKHAGESSASPALILSMLTQCFLFFKYCVLWLVPGPEWMSVDMREPFAGSIFSPYLLAAAAFAAYGIAAVRLLLLRGKWGLLGFAMLFPWLLFFTEFSVVRIQEPFVLYRSYLWMAGAFAALPVVLGFLEAKRAFIALSVAALLLGLLAVDRLTTFSNPLLLWTEAEELVKEKQDLPGVDRIYYNRAKYLGEYNYYRQSLADYQTALALNSGSIPYREGVAQAYYRLGRYAEAIAEFDQVIAKQPMNKRSYYDRGLAYAEQGDMKAALADWGKSCELGWRSGCTKAQQIKQEQRVSN